MSKVAKMCRVCGDATFLEKSSSVQFLYQKLSVSCGLKSSSGSQQIRG